MFLFTKSLEVSGVLKYENYGTPKTVSGLKSVGNPSYITGEARFVISKKTNKVIRSVDGRTKITNLTTQFGWDQIEQLNDTGIYFTPGALKLHYENEVYRLTDLDDFGQYNRNYRPIGIIEAYFERERRVNVD